MVETHIWWLFRSNVLPKRNEHTKTAGVLEVSPESGDVLLRSGRRAVHGGPVGGGRRPRRPRGAAEVRGRAGADDVDGGGGVRPGRLLPHRVPLLPLRRIGVSI